MVPSPDQPPSLELILYQLKELQKQQERDRAHADIRFDQLQAEVRTQIQAIAYVSTTTYERDRLADARITASDRKVLDDYARETREIAQDARRVAWATAAMVVAGFGLILALIKAVAG